MNSDEKPQVVLASVPEALAKFSAWLRGQTMAESVRAELEALPLDPDASVKLTITLTRDRQNPDRYRANFSTQRVVGVKRIMFRNLTNTPKPAVHPKIFPQS